MKLYFVTGNADKFNQAKIILEGSGIELIQLDLDLPEVQSLDPIEVALEKANAALRDDEIQFPFIIEDTSLYLDALNGFPGPLAKHFYLALTAKGMVELCNRYGNNKAKAITHIVYCESRYKPFTYAIGSVEGRLQYSTKYLGHGFEDVFIPKGHSLTLSEMDEKVRPLINMRGSAFRVLLNLIGVPKMSDNNSTTDSSSLEDLVKEVVTDFVNTSALFTALDVSNKVKEKRSGVRHRDVSPIVRHLFETQQMDQYSRTLINVQLANGDLTEANLYHPIEDTWDLDTKYDDLKRAQKPNPPASNPVTPVVVGVDTGSDTDQTATCFPVSTTQPVVTPVTEPVVDDESWKSVPSDKPVDEPVLETITKKLARVGVKLLDKILG